MKCRIKFKVIGKHTVETMRENESKVSALRFQGICGKGGHGQNTLKKYNRHASAF